MEYETADDLWERRGYAMRYLPGKYDALDEAIETAVNNLRRS